MRAAVGGPPHSGKSVFVYTLLTEIELLLGPSAPTLVGLVVLDLTDNTLAWLMKGEPRKLDVAWTEENVEARAQQYEAVELPLVIGDAPGEITPQLRVLLRRAEGLVIVSRDPRLAAKWEALAGELGIEVLARFHTSQTKVADAHWDRATRTGALWGLERDEVKTRGIAGVQEECRTAIRDFAYDLLGRVVEPS